MVIPASSWPDIWRLSFMILAENLENRIKINTMKKVSI
jgi:hypothetical protein